VCTHRILSYFQVSRLNPIKSFGTLKATPPYGIPKVKKSKVLVGLRKYNESTVSKIFGGST